MFWRLSFPIFFLFATFDGFISNLFFPAKLPLLYKDIFLVVIYFFFFVTERTGELVSQLKGQIGNTAWFCAIAFMLIGLFQIFNPASSSILVGILGFKVMFFYWPIALLAFTYIHKPDDVRKFLMMIVIFSIPINCFGLYQFFQGPRFMVQTFGPGFAQATVIAAIEAGTGDFVRIIGTFASSGQFSSFLVTNSAFCLGLMLTSPSLQGRVFFSGCQVLNFLTLLATGSRGWLLILILDFLIFVVISRRSRPKMMAVFFVSFSLYFGFSFLGAGVIGRYRSLQRIEMVRHRTLETTQAMFLEILGDAPLGKGLGAGSTATRHLAGVDPLAKRYLVENYLSKLQMETGIAGVLLFYIFSILLLLRIGRWLTFFRARNFEIAESLTAYAIVHFSLVSLFNLLDSPPTPIFLWATIGILARLSRFYEMEEVGV